MSRVSGFCRRVRSQAVATTLLATLCAAGDAAAQPTEAPERLPAPETNAVSIEDSRSLVVNPANLAFLPGYELRWSSHYADERSQVPWQGHAFGLALPIPWLPLATGVRFDLVDPPGGVSESSPAAMNYQWLTLGLAAALSDTAALGASWQRSYSESSAAHGLSTWSVGFTTRPWNGLGMAVVAHDFTGEPGLPPAYDLSLAVRPLGTRGLELGLEGRYVDAPIGYWAPRASLGVDLPPIGRLSAGVRVSDPLEDQGPREWVASAMLSIDYNGPHGSSRLGVGSSFGSRLGDAARYQAQSNLRAEVAMRGWREPVGPEAPHYAVKIRLETTPGTRAHVALLRQLWALAEKEPSVDAVVLELRTSPAASLARTQELRDALHHLRRSGKYVLCHLEDASGSALYLCSAANRILLNPAGGVRFAGLSVRHLYFKALLDKLGIRADFVRIGKHKSAPERFMRSSSSPTSRADTVDLLQQYEKHFVAGVAGGRRLEVKTLRRHFARGPFIATEAKAAGLVDGFAFDDQIEERLEKLTGSSLTLVEEKAPRAPARFGKSSRIAIVYVDGDMVDGRSQTIPLLGMKLVGSYTVAEAINEAKDDTRVGAIVLRVETPGGSAMAADVIWRAVERAVQVKPVIVSMGSYAASAGYYISAPASRIFANPLSITGSIGIFYGKADVAQLMQRIGVGVEVFKTAPRADAESIFRPFTEEEKKELGRKVEQFYDMFLSRVATGRKLSKSQVDKVAQGRVWTGEQAQKRKLVDELGGLRQALAHARRVANLPEHAQIIELPRPSTTLLGALLGMEGLKARSSTPNWVPPQLLSAARALSPLMVHAGDKPLARMEIVTIEP